MALNTQGAVFSVCITRNQDAGFKFKSVSNLEPRSHHSNLADRLVAGRMKSRYEVVSSGPDESWDLEHMLGLGMNGF